MTSDKLQAIPRYIWVTVLAWVASLLFCALFWFFRIGGDLKTLASTRKTLTTERSILDGIQKDLSSLSKLERDLASAKADLFRITNAHILTPLLNSYAMRSKSILEEAAAESGFIVADVRERHRVPLPTVSMESGVFFDRLGIEIIGTGSYFEIADFIAQVEKTLPYASVAGLTVSSQRTTPVRQRAVIVLEWPVQGVKPLPPPSPRGPSRRTPGTRRVTS